ncbi:MAG: hypothetical protein E7626_02410 [Ruminococcaceae bacterium]|nr:hypothetical protein [Oscillospiraceae bacterium]
MTRTTLIKRLVSSALILVTVLALLLSSTVAPLSVSAEQSLVNRYNGNLNTNFESYFNSSVIYKLPSTVKDTDEISLIVQVNKTSLLDAYEKNDRGMSISEFSLTSEASDLEAQILAEKSEMLSLLDIAGVSYTKGANYYTILSGFEICIKAGDFEKVCTTFGPRANVIVGDVYKTAETKLVENKVDVYETGIFDSSDFKYNGEGMVIAVLDTGLDYYHTAFLDSNFKTDRSKLGLTFDEVAALIGDTTAAKLQSGLTASDVYISDKVPFGFDYADYDSDVYPMTPSANDHGTHVSGVIAGHDDVITGVAPGAQLVEMKIFSDTESSARSSWILSALEDCVVLGVDVINMSIGTSCGFSREMDKEQISGVYDRIREAGISMVVAASNSFNSTYGSEKNGNLPLTSNPDSATVGSPSTYKGALCVASISGVKTPYLLYNDRIIYFTESTDRVQEEKNFFDEIFKNGETSLEVEYITIPGAGRSADYQGIDVKGKIVLVRRGSTTFEEKANVAQAKGAAGVIIYNNVSGEIKMNVGDTTIPVCSIRQDDGEALAAAKSGVIKISRSQTSGPFMSDFSSWGPTPDLELKPEITAHGGSILSAVPGQDYDRLSGTSMATPNMSGVTALMRQYVIERFPEMKDDPVAVSALVHRLMMSTADVIYNVNGLPYSVRKQGAGLANLNNSAATTAYIATYDRKDGSEMDKTKIELGDDPAKKGVYTLKFTVVNFGSTALSYDVSAYVMTEGVSETKTSHGETTVTEQGYILGGASVVVSSVSNGTLNGSNVTVGAGQRADVTVTVTLSDADKAYMDSSFENGMYVEGFIMLDATAGSEIDLSVPYLGFYGDWTEAPIFDLDYFETNKDEIDESIDVEDKTLPDAYATRPIGGISDDYVSYLGSYYFIQDPSTKLIAADRKYISLSNQTDTINSLRFVWAGLLRNAASIEISIVEDATGEVIFTKTEKDVRKSYGDGGTIYPANVKIEFSAIDANLKNNTAYTVKLKAFLDYGDGGVETNDSNTFEFPIVTDFEAPAITDVEYYTEYDKAAKKNRLFARMFIYDNHYSMALQPGYIGLDGSGEPMLYNFDQYMTPIYSNVNSTTEVVYELTNYVDDIRKAYTDNSRNDRNCFTVAVYDYALNLATYEISLPDDFVDFYFEEEVSKGENKYALTLSPNETYTLSPKTYPGTEWPELLTYTAISTNGAVRVVNNKIVAVKPGVAMITATDNATQKTAQLTVKVLGEDEAGYRRYDKPVTDNFYLTGYRTEKAYYFVAAADREIGEAGNEMKFPSQNSYSLSMYPSEAVTIRYKLDAYFPDVTKVVFESSNENLVTVDANGKITAKAEGFASVTVRVQMDGKNTYYSKTINIEIKDPYISTGPSLTHYFGLGGRVEIPSSLALTSIGQFAFSNFEYIPKDPSEITEEDPDATEMWFIGDNTIEEVIIPEGVETIGSYAFANLTALKKVVLPSTVKMIDLGAFYGCTSLQVVEGIENVKFINQDAFANCALEGKISLDSAIVLTHSAFAYNRNLTEVVISDAVQSIGISAFEGCDKLESVTIKAERVKLGAYAFRRCKSLKSVSLNAAVIPTGAFDGCESLESFTFGKDVAVIGEFAFRDTRLKNITVAEGNTTLYHQSGTPYILNKEGNEIIFVATGISGVFNPGLDNVTSIGIGAFSGNKNLTSIILPGVTSVKAYAFADCQRLTSITLGALGEIGNYAFFNAQITSLPSFDEKLGYIGKYAFAGSELTSVVIPSGMTVGEGAFYECQDIKKVVIGDNVILGDRAFRLDRESNYKEMHYDDESGVRVYYYVYTSALKELTIGKNVIIGDSAFMGAAELESVTLGEGAVIGNEAFYNADKLENIDLSKVVSIGDTAFSGDVLYDFVDEGYTEPLYDENGYVYRFFAPNLKSVKIENAEKIGEGAFEYCLELTDVTLGEKVSVISAYAFDNCTALENINLSLVKEIGESAFAETMLGEVDLSGAEKIGEYAFVYSDALEKVKLGESVHIAEGAFSYCPKLSEIENIDKATYVGDYAFAYTDVRKADLSGATYIGEFAFIKEEMTDFEVVLGDKLESMGDNPFAMCHLKPFSSTASESFNGKDYVETVYTYDISSNIKVINGLVYRVVPSGLELVCYTGDAKEIHVADGTVRIAAMAFAGADLTTVYFPKETASIGHKAFFGCDDLTLVVFASYKAPILEEEYDMVYFQSGQNLPATGIYQFNDIEGNLIEYAGLEIVPYFMWNATSNATNVYYGANFVDYIGHINGGLTMVRPANGQFYDTFIYGQYFTTKFDGASAADKITLDAIAAINKIPEKVSLSDKATVLAAKEAYDKIATYEQLALVGDALTSKLTQAEKRIRDLEYLANQGGNTETPPEDIAPVTPETPSEPSMTMAFVIIGITVAMFGLLYLANKKKSGGENAQKGAKENE